MKNDADNKSEDIAWNCVHELQYKSIKLAMENDKLKAELEAMATHDNDLLTIAYLQGASGSNGGAKILRKEIKDCRKLLCDVYNADMCSIHTRAQIVECSGAWFNDGLDVTKYA